MAGYIFTLNSPESLARSVEHGVYATVLNQPKGYWRKEQEGTFADYATMKAGDNVYFFIERMIYGVGKLVDVGPSCRYQNFPGASDPTPSRYEAIQDQLLWDEGNISAQQRWICTFVPDPLFFRLGVDMDDVLSSNPSAFRMLRALWKLSFIKFDDEENQAFRDILLKTNQQLLLDPAVMSPTDVFARHDLEVHNRIRERVVQGEYTLSPSQILSACAEEDAISHEMALEAGLLAQLSSGDAHTVAVLGEWDYLSHQVIASPFKPIDYADKMDIFGYSYLPDHKPTRWKYFAGEIKRGTAQEHEVDQVMKYVDWVKDEYCHGDFSMIEAVLIAYDFPPEVILYRDRVAKRTFTLRRRPAMTVEWKRLRLIKYRYDEALARLNLEEV